MSSGGQLTRPELPKRYRFERLLGDGAAGKVYLVHDTERDDALVALKILSNMQAFDEHTVERFCAEIEASKSLEHPNLIKAYDYVALEHTIGFTMEYVEGDDLSKVIRSRRSLRVEDIISILRQLLDALEVLHERGIVHRDIKLENVMLRADGRVKLSDLGLMKKLGESGLTKSGMLLGTAQYMPPEYVEGGEYGTSGDMYSLGVLILELFAGRRRLEGKVAGDALQELLNTRFQIPAALLEEVPRMYRPLIRKATAVRVTDRFRAARDMRSALDELDRGPRLEPSLKREVRTKNFGTRAGAGRRLFTSRSSLLKLVVISGIFLGAAFGFMISR